MHESTSKRQGTTQFLTVWALLLYLHVEFASMQQCARCAICSVVCMCLLIHQASQHLSSGRLAIYRHKHLSMFWEHCHQQSPSTALLHGSTGNCSRHLLRCNPLVLLWQLPVHHCRGTPQKIHQVLPKAPWSSQVQQLAPWWIQAGKLFAMHQHTEKTYGECRVWPVLWGKLLPNVPKGSQQVPYVKDEEVVGTSRVILWITLLGGGVGSSGFCYVMWGNPQMFATMWCADPLLVKAVPILQTEHVLLWEVAWLIFTEDKGEKKTHHHHPPHLLHEHEQWKGNHDMATRKHASSPQ